MAWPTPQDYNEAIQSPKLNFGDPELQGGTVALNSLGLPRAITGAFASVYRIKCPDREWAVRCFLHNIDDQKDRYGQLSTAISSGSLPYMVGFQYLEQGIKVQGAWYPILKMEWIEGTSLDNFLSKSLRDEVAIESVKQQFVTVTEHLKRSGIAHGDLQHGNIMLVDGELKLVDYDGMFVPALDGYRSNELGHPNYQHPRRTPRHFGSFLDNFSAWVIYISLHGLSKDISLWARLNAGDECLLFRRRDFLFPDQSHAFSLLEKHGDREVMGLAALLKSLTAFPMKQVPALDLDYRTPKDLPEIDTSLIEENEEEIESSDVSSQKPFRLAKLTNLPDWMQAGDNSDIEKLTKFLGPWPHFEAYKTAISQCSEAFQDPELRNGVLIHTDYGCGPHGAVFHVRCVTRHIGVKVFFRHVADRQARYEEISKAISGPISRYFVEFEYIPEGIKVGKYWYPILKMEWIRGLTINQIAEYYKGDKSMSFNLIERFRMMVDIFKRAGIAHGDIHPSNILVVNNDFKLLDYDGMFVPAMDGWPAIETGTSNYQHAGRTLNHFNSSIDCYSTWMLDTMLMLMATDHSLWDLVNKRLEYTGRGATWPFKFVDLNSNYSIRERVKMMNKIHKGSYEEVPPLPTDFDAEYAALKALSAGDGDTTARSSDAQSDAASKPGIFTKWFKGK